jgi:hypothetical protein
MSAPDSSDKAAAFKGLVVTTVLLAVMAYGIVLLTNRKFADHAPAAGAPATPAAAKH